MSDDFNFEDMIEFEDSTDLVELFGSEDSDEDVEDTEKDDKEIYDD